MNGVFLWGQGGFVCERNYGGCEDENNEDTSFEGFFKKGFFLRSRWMFENFGKGI
jgi:hypothetical protein